MGMSTHLTGYCNPTDEYKRMRDVWNACKAAGIDIPHEVYTYFHQNTIEGEPDENGITITLDDDSIGVEALPGESGFLVDLDQLPKCIRRIKFENSW